MLVFAVGYLMNHKGSILMFRNNMPNELVGMLNGFVAPVTDDTPKRCLINQLYIQTGDRFGAWEQFGKMTMEGLELHLFRGYVDSFKAYDFAVNKDSLFDSLHVIKIKDLIDDNVLPSALWQVYMAIDTRLDGIKVEC